MSARLLVCLGLISVAASRTAGGQPPAQPSPAPTSPGVAETRSNAHLDPAIPGEPDGRVTRVFTIEHAEPWDMSHLIRTQFAGRRGARDPNPIIATAIGGTRAIAVTTTPERMEEVADLVEAADKAPMAQPRLTRFFRLHHANAGELADLLNRVHQSAIPKPPAGCYAVSYDAEMNTNTLIVTASSNELVRIQDMVERLDLPKRPHPVAPQRSPARVQIAVFRLSALHNGVAAIDVNKLAADADTCRAFKGALCEFGEPEILYRCDSTIDLTAGADVSVGTRRPILAGIQRSPKGQVTSQVNYECTGTVVSIRGGWDADARLTGHVKMELQASAVCDSTVEIAPDVRAPLLQELTQPFDGPIESGRPIVLMSVDAGGQGERPAVYVTWVVFHRPS